MIHFKNLCHCQLILSLQLQLLIKLEQSCEKEDYDSRIVGKMVELSEKERKTCRKRNGRIVGKGTEELSEKGTEE